MHGPDLCWTSGQQYANVVGPEVGQLGESEGRTGTGASLGRGRVAGKGSDHEGSCGPCEGFGETEHFLNPALGVSRNGRHLVTWSS